MFSIIEIILPVFGLILLGFWLGKINFFTPAGIGEISKFIFYLAIPALIFRTGAQGLDTKALELSMLVLYYGVNLLIFIVCLALGERWLGLTRLESPVFATGTIYSNLVLVGLPIVQTRFGQPGLVALMTIISINTLILFTLPSTLIELRQRSNASLLQTVGITLRSVLRNPLVIAIVAGFSWGLSGAELPYVVDQFTGLLGQAAAPCALFAVGASLSQYQLKGHLRESWLITGVKLVLAPLLVWFTGHYLFDLSPVWLAVATLSAGLPVGANVFILSQRYGSYEQVASSAILLSTFSAILTLSALLLAMAGI